MLNNESFPFQGSAGFRLADALQMTAWEGFAYTTLMSWAGRRKGECTYLHDRFLTSNTTNRGTSAGCRTDSFTLTFDTLGGEILFPLGEPLLREQALSLPCLKAVRQICFLGGACSSTWEQVRALEREPECCAGPQWRERRVDSLIQ